MRTQTQYQEPLEICLPDGRRFAIKEWHHQARQRYRNTVKNHNIRKNRSHMPRRTRVFYTQADLDFVNTHTTEEIAVRYGLTRPRANHLRWTLRQRQDLDQRHWP